MTIRTAASSIPFIVFLGLLETTAFAEPQSFVNFGTFFVNAPSNAPTVDGIGQFTPGAFSWFADDVHDPFPGWDANVRWEWHADYTGPFTPSEDDPLVFSAPFVSESTIFAHDNDGNLLGTMVLQGTGALAADAKAASAVVDPVSGQVMTPYFNTVSGFDAPVEIYSVVERTGKFLGIEPVGQWQLFGAGLSSRPLFAGQDVQEGALNPVFASHSTLAIVGQFEAVPEPRVLPAMVCGAMIIVAAIRRRSRDSRSKKQGTIVSNL